MTDRATSKSNDGVARLIVHSQLGESDVSAVKQLLGRTVHRVYASCLQVAGQHYTAPSFSIPISDQINESWVHRYIVVRCEWEETPKWLLDYWQISISNDGKPDGIEDAPQKGIVAPCTINFFAAKPVVKIEVYSLARSASDETDSEEIQFDQAIRFWLEDGSSFCIACQLNGPGVATEVHISADEQSIMGFLEFSRSRQVITA